MYYVLSFKKGTDKKDFQSFNTEDNLILYLFEHGNEIRIHKIIEAAAELKFGLINVLDTMREKTEEEEIKDFKAAEKELKEEVIVAPFPEATEPEELTQEEIDAEIIQKNKEALNHTDKAIAAAAKDQKEDKAYKWKICPKCNVNKVAPWSKHKECSRCRRKGTRKYDMTKRGKAKE